MSEQLDYSNAQKDLNQHTMSNNSARSLSVIIPNYNGETLLPLFMPSLFRALQHYQAPYEVIIIDDCSKDKSLEAMATIQATYPNVKLLYNEVNKGFSATCNAGIEAAQFEIMFFFNSDVEIEEDYFNYFSSYFDQPDVFAVTTCGFYYADRKKPLDGIRTGVWKRGLPRATGNIFNQQIEKSGIKPPYFSFAVQGAYFFADSEKVRHLGGFDEIYSPYIYEEIDMGYRAIKRGWKIHYEPRCVGYHQISASIDKAGTNFTKRVISHRNRIIFVWKNIDHLPFLVSHCFFILLKLLSLNRVYINAVRQAWQQRKLIKQRRDAEKAEAVISDKALFEYFKEYQNKFN